MAYTTSEPAVLQYSQELAAYTLKQLDSWRTSLELKGAKDRAVTPVGDKRRSKGRIYSDRIAINPQHCFIPSRELATRTESAGHHESMTIAARFAHFNSFDSSPILYPRCAVLRLLHFTTVPHYCLCIATPSVTIASPESSSRFTSLSMALILFLLFGLSTGDWLFPTFADNQLRAQAPFESTNFNGAVFAP
ncbi:hypothetical protein BV22DRAFT_525535 [Leucogyrophana mollusca]|uniref:Uncharacterized protein n=1 Tax=Leucogyrophana mollusca TaxID=85980 RepID=A0ACB8BG47_9AGAM|nr:hypothetical protein BV22DRAFT_525535 [Leucogyrophana mollusca]